MKILLFGEYSGFFNCLKDGFEQLGHEVFLVSDGDGKKDFPSDFRWDTSLLKGTKINTIMNVSNLYLHRKLLKGYDIVLIVGPELVSSTHLWLNKPIYKYLIANNKKVYLSGAGISSQLFDYWYDSDSKYHYYMQGYFSEGRQPVFYHNQKMREWENYLFNNIAGYIPIWYEYFEPFKHYSSCKSIVRIPVNPSKFSFTPNIIHDGKVVFYHGITGPHKGVRFIKPAFDKMRQKYGNQAEFICAEKLPFDEYMKVVERTNIIVDDANSYSVAMNGLFSMLKGKIIMGGAEPVANLKYGYEYNPVFNICPDVDQICSVIEDIMSKRDSLDSIAKEGRKFVEQYHNYIEIAQQYIDIFTAE